jgi:NAD kinase
LNCPFDKIVVVTKHTQVEELIMRFNTRAQARFYIKSLGGDVSVYESAHELYRAAAATLRLALAGYQVRTQWIERDFLPTFTFGRNDLVITLGPDGIVVNTAKYLDSQPLLAFNPDPATIDGVLIPFDVNQAAGVIGLVLSGVMPTQTITMAQAVLKDGRSLFAVNDLFIGQKTHVSARYVLKHAGQEEAQSSSGIIVSTGAGSSGWHRSILAGAAGEMAAYGSSKALEKARAEYRFDPSSRWLVFHVREPFESRTSSAGLVRGKITMEQPLEVVSQMPKNGVIFSDGIEADFLDFNSGAVATVQLAQRHLNLVQAAAGQHS